MLTWPLNDHPGTDFAFGFPQYFEATIPARSFNIE
jgi:hypothetical protein